MHTGAGACIFKQKELEKGDLLLLIETQFVMMGKFRIYGHLRHKCVMAHCTVSVQIA